MTGLLFVTGRAAAQQQPVAYSIDAAGGGGLHNANLGGTGLRYTAAAYGRAAATAIFSLNHRVRATVTIERETTFQATSGASEACDAQPNGVCAPIFPDLAGYGASVGLRVNADSGIDLDIGAGGASLKGPSEFFIADMALALSTHVSAVLGAHPMLLQLRSGEHLWWAPITIGIRFD